jgi:hypothetical protein
MPPPSQPSLAAQNMSLGRHWIDTFGQTKRHGIGTNDQRIAALSHHSPELLSSASAGGILRGGHSSSWLAAGSGGSPAAALATSMARPTPPISSTRPIWGSSVRGLAVEGRGLRVYGLMGADLMVRVILVMFCGRAGLSSVCCHGCLVGWGRARRLRRRAALLSPAPARDTAPHLGSFLPPPPGPLIPPPKTTSCTHASERDARRSAIEKNPRKAAALGCRDAPLAPAAPSTRAPSPAPARLPPACPCPQPRAAGSPAGGDVIGREEVSGSVPAAGLAAKGRSEIGVAGSFGGVGRESSVEKRAGG